MTLRKGSHVRVVQVVANARAKVDVTEREREREEEEEKKQGSGGLAVSGVLLQGAISTVKCVHCVCSAIRTVTAASSLSLSLTTPC